MDVPSVSNGEFIAVLCCCCFRWGEELLWVLHKGFLFVMWSIGLTTIPKSEWSLEVEIEGMVFSFVLSWSSIEMRLEGDFLVGGDSDGGGEGDVGEGLFFIADARKLSGNLGFKRFVNFALSSGEGRPSSAIQASLFESQSRIMCPIRPQKVQYLGRRSYFTSIRHSFH